MAGPMVLIVEDEPLIAMSMQLLVEDAGWVALGPFGNSAQAVRAVEGGADIACALLDCNLGGETSWPVADALVKLGVPFAFISGQGAKEIPPRFSGRPIFAKPVDDGLVHQFLKSAAP